MKSFISHAVVICVLSLIPPSHVGAQSGALPSASPAAGQDAKEKAEDAALIQQLEADQPAPPEAKPKGPRAPGTMRGAGGGGLALNVSPAAGPFRVQNLLTRPMAAPRALVVRTSEPDPKAQAALEEDLAVMSHLLYKSLEDLPGGPGNGNKVMGIDVFFSPGAAPLRSLYLDNYGAVFFLSVNFPLIAPAENRAEEKPIGDSAWEDARQELYGQHAAGGPGGPAEEYSQEKVDKLKDTLFEGLKNATNIRGLKPEEYVTIWVCGGNGGRTSRAHVSKNNQPGNFGANAFEPTAARRTIMTIRVTKSEIDSCAKGKLPIEEFHKHARITAYTGDSSGASPEGIAIGTYTQRGF